MNMLPIEHVLGRYQAEGFINPVWGATHLTASSASVDKTNILQLAANRTRIDETGRDLLLSVPNAIIDGKSLGLSVVRFAERPGLHLTLEADCAFTSVDLSLLMGPAQTQSPHARVKLTEAQGWLTFGLPLRELKNGRAMQLVMQPTPKWTWVMAVSAAIKGNPELGMVESDDYTICPVASTVPAIEDFPCDLPLKTAEVIPFPGTPSR